MLHHSLAQHGIAKSHPFNLNPYRYDWGDAQTGGLSRPTMDYADFFHLITPIWILLGFHPHNTPLEGIMQKFSA